MTLSTQAKLFLSHFLAIILVSGSIGTYFYHGAIEALRESLQARLKYSAALLQGAFEPDLLDTLRVPADRDSTVYRQYLLKLRELQASNPDIAFLYIMRLEPQQAVHFVLDSDPDKPAQPGQIYETVNRDLLSGFQRPSVDAEITTDAWGSFLSGYAPVLGAEGRYLIGIDMRADEVREKLRTLQVTGVSSLLISLLLAFVFSHWLSKGMRLRIERLHRRCVEASLSARLEPVRGDELDQLGATLDQMLEQLHRHHHELEHQVSERTRALKEANRQLRHEIEERTRIGRILEETARTDYLTQLMNRRAMAERLQAEVARVERGGAPFSLVLIDIDHFKNINDNFGHDVGDEVLKSLSRAFAGHVREQDIVARWGGEEFLLLLPSTGERSAAEQAERLRQLLDRGEVRVSRYSQALTASFGVCEYTAGEGIKALLKKADVALYRAKVSGRNRVMTTGMLVAS